MATKRVLIVEDDTSSRMALAELLREEGFDAHGVATAAAALSACLNAAPDLVLLDYRLPDGNGVELIVRLRAEAEIRCPIILVSGSSDLEIAADGSPGFVDHESAAIEAGATGYVPKPIDLDALLDVMRRAIDGK